MKFNITFKRSSHVVATVCGYERPMEALSIADVTNRIIEAEQYLEKLTGMRVHIEQADEEAK